MKLSLWMVLLLVSSGAFAETVGSNYSRRGASQDNVYPYRMQQRWNTGSQYRGGHGYDRSEFRNWWYISRGYEMDANGNPIVEGQMGTQGEAVRGYVHDGSPKAVERIERKEAELQQSHREYLDTTQNSYRVTAERKMLNARGEGSRRFNDSMIETQDILRQIERKLHSEEMRGQ